MNEGAMWTKATTSVKQNRLLALLPEEELVSIKSRAERVRLRPRQILHHWRSPLEHVYFLTDGLVSVGGNVGENEYVEAWLIGSEGAVGAILLLTGRAQAAPHRRVVQVGGSALRLSAPDFLELADRLPTFRQVLHRYLAVVMVQTSQAGVCNAVHSVKQRLARWLLVASQGLDSHDLPLTHDVLSRLLGVRRASVTECLSELEDQGVISTHRGHIEITNPDLLRQTSCACFQLIHREYVRQLTSVGRCL
ncbi:MULTISPECIES: Crp/Fnr family transcriptional regulator [Bradyrhizobium]|nr:Crp/Fnr family transcriptional regulator [Bradyrhizobium canariense]